MHQTNVYLHGLQSLFRHFNWPNKFHGYTKFNNNVVQYFFSWIIFDPHYSDVPMWYLYIQWLSVKILWMNVMYLSLVKKFPALYETCRFITMFTTAHHWPLSYIIGIQSTYWQTISILILSLQLCFGLPSGLFLHVFWPICCINFSSFQCMLHALLISSSLIIVLKK
jgi:hypothetical protein